MTVRRTKSAPDDSINDEEYTDANRSRSLLLHIKRRLSKKERAREGNYPLPSVPQDEPYLTVSSTEGTLKCNLERQPYSDTDKADGYISVGDTDKKTAKTSLLANNAGKGETVITSTDNSKSSKHHSYCNLETKQETDHAASQDNNKPHRKADPPYYNLNPSALSAKSNKLPSQDDKKPAGKTDPPYYNLNPSALPAKSNKLPSQDDEKPAGKTDPPYYNLNPSALSAKSNELPSQDDKKSALSAKPNVCSLSKAQKPDKTKPYVKLCTQ